MVKNPLFVLSFALWSWFTLGTANAKKAAPVPTVLALAQGDWFPPSVYVRPDKQALPDGYARQFGATPFGASRKSLTPKD